MPRGRKRGKVTECLNRTSVGLKHKWGLGFVDVSFSLNRTSVGLKRKPNLDKKSTQASPQSNQRGIETTINLGRPERVVPGLNRTSVGLKRRKLNTTSESAELASIEPAWD